MLDNNNNNNNTTIYSIIEGLAVLPGGKTASPPYITII
jgi:hypothetical protein